VQLSLRTRLTAWYSVLLVLTLALFSAAVLWMQWRLTIEQVDAGIESLGDTAANVVDEEIAELHDLRRAVAEMREVVHSGDDVIQVLDAAGAPLHEVEARFPGPANSEQSPRARTVQDASGRYWRLALHASAAPEHAYVVVVGAPLDAALREWAVLLRACLIGMPLAVAFAVAGGLLLGRHGLRPLTTMAADSQAVTAQTPTARLTVPHDVTELERLATSFNRVLDRLNDALSTQRRFMADASHELRTPISIMRTAAEVTLSQPSRDEPEYREALSAVAQHSARLTRLVEDMLVLARADGGGYPIRPAPLDLAALIRDCITDLQSLTAARRIVVTSRLDPLTLIGDETLLRRMCANLIGNALTYTPIGGSVRVSLDRVGDRALVRVTDSGPGIPPADRERVFERFVRLDEARATGGSGLGLAIARWVAEAHGGSLTLDSSDAAGSTFAASLPLDRAITAAVQPY
jgi:heavy metal sensor kinase